MESTAYLRTRYALLFDQLVTSFTLRHTEPITRAEIKLLVIDLRLVAAQLRARGFTVDDGNVIGGHH